jgi:hypothetical protein
MGGSKGEKTIEAALVGASAGTPWPPPQPFCAMIHQTSFALLAFFCPPFHLVGSSRSLCVEMGYLFLALAGGTAACTVVVHRSSPELLLDSFAPHDWN